jgi:FkbM family methyltransferase
MIATTIRDSKPRLRPPLSWKLAVSLRKRWLAARRLLGLARDGEFLRCSYWGADFLCPPQGNVFAELILHRFEWFQLPRLIAACERLRPKVFLDVGAHCGIYTCIVGRRRLAPRLIAFEPNRKTLVHLKAHLLINGLAEMVELHEGAAGEAPGRAQLFPQEGLTHIVSSGGAYEVSVTPLDDVVDLIGETIAIKIDVEGYEMAVLAGAKLLLSRNRGYAQIEALHDRDIAVIPLMQAYGWRFKERLNDDLVFEKP